VPRAGPGALDFVAADGRGLVLAAGFGYQGATDYDAQALVVADDPRRPGARFFTLAPCRVTDTRDAALGGPSPLAAGSQVDVPVAGRCGVPHTARAIAANLTAVAPDSAGYFTAFPTGRIPPGASLLNHGAGVTRANQATLGLGDLGKLSVRVFQPSGSVHVLIDVAGYFE
jgi:serine protease